MLLRVISKLRWIAGRCSHRPGQLLSLLFVIHTRHLKGDTFEPGLRTLYARKHCGKLGPDDGLRYEGSTKSFSLCRIPR